MHPRIEQYLERVEHCWNGFDDDPIEKRMDNSLRIIREVDGLFLTQDARRQFKYILTKKLEECKIDFLKTENYCQMAGVSRKGLEDILVKEIEDIFS